MSSRYGHTTNEVNGVVDNPADDPRNEGHWHNKHLDAELLVGDGVPHAKVSVADHAREQPSVLRVECLDLGWDRSVEEADVASQKQGEMLKKKTQIRHSSLILLYELYLREYRSMYNNAIICLYILMRLCMEIYTIE